MNGLPTLNSIVVGRITKLPGSGVVLSEGRSERQQIAAVLKENWFAIRVPTTGTFRLVWDSVKGKKGPW